MPSGGTLGARLVREQPGVVALVGLEELAVDGERELERSLTVVTTLVEQAFSAGHHRVEAEVEPGHLSLRRVLQRAGLRPEGLARGRAVGGEGDGIPVDVLRLARLRDDPAPGTPQAFLAMLNASLPTKRLIVQGLVGDGAGRVLLCELTYKQDWDLVGGVAEPAETPVASLGREVREELGLDLPVGDLVAVDWLPPYKQWADALLLVFDLGEHPDLLDRVTLQPSELRGVHWCTPQEAQGRVAPYVHRLLSSVVGGERVRGGRTLFLEDGLPRRV
jgi:8-oxo-dGTP pyrophosphatase MutT (NUDIX family)